MNPISVLLVDDNPTFLQEHDDMVVAGTVGGGEEVLAQLPKTLKNFQTPS